MRLIEKGLIVPLNTEFDVALDACDAAQLIAISTAVGLTPSEYLARIASTELGLIADAAMPLEDERVLM